MHIQWLKGHIGRVSAIAQDAAPSPHAAIYASEPGIPATRPERLSLTRQVIVVAALMWLATRIAYLAMTFIPIRHLGLTFGRAPTDRLLLWSQFDANWYLHIARNGYDSRASAAFFPLYPLLTRGLSLLLGDAHALLAAIIIANLGSLLAFISLGLLVAHDAHRETAAFPAIRVLAAYPFAFFLFAPYTEGLFLGLSVFAVLCARRGLWKWAALCAFLAGTTRATAIILVPSLLWEFGRQRGWWQRAIWQTGYGRVVLRDLSRMRPLGEFVLTLGAVPLAVGLFMLYCANTLGRPLAPFEAQRQYWGRTPMPVWATLGDDIGNLFAAPVGGSAQLLILTDLGAILLFTAVTVFSIGKVPVAYTIYMAGLLYLSIAMPISRLPSIIDAAARFMLAAFPVWLVVGRWIENRPWLDMLVVSVGFSLQALCAVLFMSGILIQ